MTSKIDARRLRDGKAALDRSRDLSLTMQEMTLAELRDLRDALFHGVLAMQSLDDLGSPEANQSAAADHDELSRRMAAIDVEVRARCPTTVDPPVVALWVGLTDGQRLDLMSICCRACGVLDRRCRCWDDR